MLIKRMLSLSVLIAFSLYLSPDFLHAQQANDKPCASTATGDLEIVSMPSKVFGNERNLRIWLPPGYRESKTEKYSVLYMFDGQMLFDRCTAPGRIGEWRIDETLTDLIAKHLVEPIIVVGIDNAGELRDSEFSPYFNIIPFGMVRPQRGDLIPEFMAQDVLPFVAARYRIKTGKEHTGIGGSSLGGVAALTALVRRPDIFGLGLLESTSLQRGNGQFLRDTNPLVMGPIRVSIGVGTVEMGPDAKWLGVPEYDSAFVALNQTLAANFKAAMANRPEVLMTVQQGAHHHPDAWGTRFPTAVRFIFPPVSK